MITISQSGDFKHIEQFLDRMKKRDVRQVLNKYGKLGVDYLSEDTPVDTGETASSWSYEVETGNGRHEIYWSNSNVNNGVNIAIILQYGHQTKNGGYVQGVDYINPALAKVFEQMANELWEEVVRA